ncbi:MAG: hypothetical protein VKP57_04270 [Candidatus Sericytochromatia bacterium]|nr:hypothetical protein [Candidatus Sericytochromatia bacterium]
MSRLPKTLLAATLALAVPGCATDNLGAMPTTAKQTIARLSSVARTVGAAMVQDAVTALVEESNGEAADYAVMDPGTSAPAYRVQLAGAPQPPEGMVGITSSPRGEDGPMVGSQPAQQGAQPIQQLVQRPLVDGRPQLAADFKDQINMQMPLAERMRPDGSKVKRGKPVEQAKLDQVKKHVGERVEKMKGKIEAQRKAVRDAMGKDNAKRKVLVGDDGTVAVVSSFEHSNKAGTHTVTAQQIFKGTSDADVKPENLLSSEVRSSRTTKDGIKSSSVRTVAVNEDGTKDITFTHTLTRKDGKTKTVSWERTVAADGSSSGEGKIVRFDGSEITIVRSMAADGTVKATVTDTRNKVKAEVALDEATGKVDAEVASTEAPAERESVAVPDAEAAEPAAE